MVNAAEAYKRQQVLTATPEALTLLAETGYDPVYANENPNRVAPYNVLKEMEKEGEIGEIYPYLITTTGNSTSVADATRFGKEIAEELKAAGVQGVILTST